MKKIIALAVALCMIICMGIKFNVVSMNSPEDSANQALIEKWQNVNSEINKLEESLAQGDQTVLERINMLKQERKELQKNAHVYTFITMMNQAPIRAAIPAPNCKTYLRPDFINFMYAQSFEHLLRDTPLDLVAWNPDGTKLVTGSMNGSKIWDVNSGKLLYTLQENIPTYAVAWSPDGTKLALSSGDNIQIWDINPERLFRTIHYADSVSSIAWSPDSTKIATAFNNRIQICEVNSGVLIHTLQDEFPIWSVVWNPDGTKIASVGPIADLSIWNTDTGTLIRTQANSAGNLVAWSPDGTKLATRSLFSLNIWDANTGALIKALPNESVFSVAWNPDGIRVATASDNGTYIWNINTGAIIITLAHDDASSSVAWSPDGTKLAAGSADGIRIWHVSELIQLLDSPNIDQCDLLRAIDMAMTQTGRIQATDEQWKTFTSFPQGVQQTLKLYIKAPIQRSIKEREAAFEQRQQTSSSTTTQQP